MLCASFSFSASSFISGIIMLARLPWLRMVMGMRALLRGLGWEGFILTRMLSFSVGSSLSYYGGVLNLCGEIEFDGAVQFVMASKFKCFYDDTC